MTRLLINRVVTTDISEAEKNRETNRTGGPPLFDHNTIVDTLEHLVGDEPIILQAYGVRDVDGDGTYTMRECRAVIGYKSERYIEIERKREEQERKLAEERKRDSLLKSIRQEVRASHQAKLDAIAQRVAVEREAERQKLELELEAESQKRFREEAKK